jgi:phosphoserine phosphatase RsbU/P
MMMTVDQSELSAERLRLLYRLSQTFNSSLDLDEVLNRVMDEVIAVTRAERGFVMLPESDGQLYFHAARGIEQQTIDTPEFHISRGLVDRVAAERQPLLTSDAQSDDRLSMRRSVVNLGLRSILCVPMLFRDKLVGVIYVDNRLQAGLFTQAELELLTAVAASAAIAIDNARLYQLAIEKGRMEQELQMARDLQRSLLPQYAPRLPGWQFVTHWQPARQVAGDFYDFIPTGDQLGLIIADVSDKGMAAALFMALSRTVLRASLAQAPSVEGIVQGDHQKPGANCGTKLRHLAQNGLCQTGEHQLDDQILPSLEVAPGFWWSPSGGIVGFILPLSVQIVQAN